MKYSSLFTVFIIMHCLSSCSKSEDIITACIEDKIQEFKQRHFATSVWRINKPGQPLYWFKDSIVDAGEELMNEDCALICITDCECSGFVFCEPSLWDYPREIIWEK